MSNKQNNIDLPLHIDDENQEAMVSLWWTSTLLKKIARRFFTKHNTSEAQFNMLHTISHLDRPVTQKELSEILLVDKSNITGLLDRAEKEEYIIRKAVPGDRRSYHVALTDNGKQMLNDVGGLYEKIVAQVMSGFTVKEKQELVKLTHKMRLAIDEIEI